MISSQVLKQLLSQLSVPAQDLAQLGFCDSSREASMKAWVRSLPLTQIQFVSGLLYQALPELGRFQTVASNRFNLLEILRIPTIQTTQGLAQGFLNQPLILPGAAVKTATVAQALQKHLITGYLVVVRDICRELSPEKEIPVETRDLLAAAIHRAISSIGLLLLRNYQLYVPVADYLWTELHTLFQLALHLGLSEIGVVDTLPHHQLSNTISLTYMRTLLLACARPNQLRQDEIAATYDALDELSAFAQLQDTFETNNTNLFAVALNSNRPPMYRSRFKSQPHRLLLEINTTRVCQVLQELHSTTGAETQENTGLRNALALTSSLTLHLIQAWNVLAQRNFERQQISGFLDVAVGITNIHYHMAGGVSFTHFLNKTNSAQSIENGNSIFQKRGVKLKDKPTGKADDPWGDAFDVTGTPMAGRTLSTGKIELAIRQQEGKDDKNLHPTYKVPLIDSSPGGYCLEWRDEIPNQVKAGELLGLRDPARNRWSLGVVRWANQTKGATQLGIQILAPQVTPVGMAIVHKTGGSSEYLRALEIPALKAINQPVTLITNAISFREYSKARIYRHTQNEQGGEDQNIQLTRRLFATGAFSQFTYRELTTGKPKNADKSDDFESVWD